MSSPGPCPARTQEPKCQGAGQAVPGGPHHLPGVGGAPRVWGPAWEENASVWGAWGVLQLAPCSPETPSVSSWVCCSSPRYMPTAPLLRLSSCSPALAQSPLAWPPWGCAGSHPGWGADAAWSCSSTSCLLVSLTGRDPEQSQEALEDFREFSRAKGLNQEILELAQSGRKDACAWSCPIASMVEPPAE